MSYVTKYIVEIASVYNNQWNIEFQEDGFSGSVTNLISTGSPLKFEFLSDSDSYNEPIRPSKAIVNVHSLTDFQLLDFYTEQDFRLKTVISLNGLLYWSGFVVTGEYQEPYDCTPYPVQITSIDGLNYFKELPYAESVSVNDAGEEVMAYYEDRTAESKIIFDILGKIWATQFTEFVNMYDVAMADSVDDSPIDQTLIDVDVFRDMSCWDVLTEVLKKYNAVIRQASWLYEGFIIYRPSELSLATVYGRTFTAWDTKTSVWFAPAQDISRSTIASNLRQFPDSELMIKRAAKRVVINQDYGYKKSWIDNYEIKGNTLSGSTTIWTLQQWTKTNTFLIQPATVIGEPDGVLIVTHNSYPTIGYYLSQSFGTYLKATSDTCFIEFDYLIYNGGASDVMGIEHLYVRIQSDDNTKFLYAVSDAVCGWDNSSNLFDIAVDAPVGTSGWITFKRRVPGLPVDGPYSVYLYGLDDAYTDIYPVFKNIRFYSTSDKVVIKTAKPKKPFGEIFFIGKRQLIRYLDFWDKEEVVSKRYVLENAVKGVDMGNDYLLGDVIDSDIDNIIEQFQGALAVNTVPPVATSSWNAGGVSAPLLELTGGEIGLQHSRPKQLIQMNIFNSVMDLNIIGSFADSLNLYKGVERKFVFNAGELDAKNEMWNADLIEIIETVSETPVPPPEYGALYNWYAVNGQI